MRFAAYQINTTNKCIFGCSETADESIEHYVHCKVLQGAGNILLNSVKWKSKCFDLQLPFGVEETILFRNSYELGEVAFCATWIFLLYSTYNGFLHAGSKDGNSLNPRTICDFMRTQVNDLVGSPKSNLWLV